MNDSISIRNSIPENHDRFVVFRLDEQGYALYLPMVEKVVRAVEITPLPKAPEAVLGVINWMGRVLPVVNIRARFRLPSRPMDLTDRFIFVRTPKRWVALLADSVDGVLIRPRNDVVSPEEIVPGLDYVDGVVKLEDGMVLIHDLDKFLSLDEEALLDKALQETME